VATVILVVVNSELLLFVPVDVLSSFILYICVTRLSVTIRSDRLSPCGEHDNITIFDNDHYVHPFAETCPRDWRSGNQRATMHAFHTRAS
jgi:hypothetical protein